MFVTQVFVVWNHSLSSKISAEKCLALMLYSNVETSLQNHKKRLSCLFTILSLLHRMTEGFQEQVLNAHTHCQKKPIILYTSVLVGIMPEGFNNTYIKAFQIPGLPRMCPSVSIRVRRTFVTGSFLLLFFFLIDYDSDINYYLRKKKPKVN